MRVVHKDSFASLFLVLVVYIVSGKKAMQVETFIHNVVDNGCNKNFPLVSLNFSYQSCFSENSQSKLLLRQPTLVIFLFQESLHKPYQ